MKRSGSSDQGQYRFKKRIQTHGGPSPPKVNLRKEGVLKMSNLHMSLVERGISMHSGLEEKSRMREMMMTASP